MRTLVAFIRHFIWHLDARAYIYTALTAIIILLAKLRKWLGRKLGGKYAFVTRRDRDKQNIMPGAFNDMMASNYAEWRGVFIACCDCDLEHKFYFDKDGNLHGLPVRPNRYKYKCRGKW
jgi:hypothetical protein